MSIANLLTENDLNLYSKSLTTNSLNTENMNVSGEITSPEFIGGTISGTTGNFSSNVAVTGNETIGGTLSVINNISCPGLFINSSLNLLNTYIGPFSYIPTDVSGAGLTFVFAIGAGIKIGKLVFVSFQLQFPSTSNTSHCSISLPYFAQSTYNFAQYNFCVSTSNGDTIALVINPGNNNFNMVFNTGLLRNTDVSGQSLNGTLIYLSNS